MLGALVSSSFALAGLIVSRVKCIYRHTPDGCQPACACRGQPLEHQEEDNEIRQIEIEGTTIAVMMKKTS